MVLVPSRILEVLVVQEEGLVKLVALAAQEILLQHLLLKETPVLPMLVILVVAMAAAVLALLEPLRCPVAAVSVVPAVLEQLVLLQDHL